MKSIAPLLRKKWLLAVIAAAVVGSGAYAFAATLGVSTATLGAGNAAVTSCASSIAATYTSAYDPALAAGVTGGNETSSAGEFAVNTVTLTFTPASVAACTTGDQVQVVLTKADKTALTSFVYTIGDHDTFTTSAPYKTIQVTAASTAGAGTAYPVSPTVDTAPGGLVTGPFSTSAADPTSASAVPARDVVGIAISAVGAAAS